MNHVIMGILGSNTYTYTVGASAVNDHNACIYTYMSVSHRKYVHRIGGPAYIYWSTRGPEAQKVNL